MHAENKFRLRTHKKFRYKLIAFLHYLFGEGRADLGGDAVLLLVLPVVALSGMLPASCRRTFNVRLRVLPHQGQKACRCARGNGKTVHICLQRVDRYNKVAYD
jgi:hypothetical protein